MTEDERDILLARYFDGSATAEQLEVLDRAVAGDPAIARAMFAAAGHELSLCDGLAAAPHGLKIANGDSGALPGVSIIEKESPAPLRGWWTARVRVWTSIAACVLLAAGITYWMARPSSPASPQIAQVKPQPPQPLATLVATGPGVMIERAGVSQPGGSDAVISSQDIVATGFAPASFVYAQEQTTVTVAGRSRLSLAGDSANKRLELHAGSINCEVQKQQPGHPLIIGTPQARVQVVGTRFDVTTRGEWTRVDVSHGTVRVTRVSDGATVDVSAGEHVYCGNPNANAPGTLPSGFTVAKGRDMAPYWSTKARPAGIEH